MGSILLILWSILISSVEFAMRILALFSKKARDALAGRAVFGFGSALPKVELEKKRALFFCSSAGEYEQALPVIQRLSRHGVQVLIVFFSRSGYQFAQKRQEDTAFVLAPLDAIWAWRLIFAKFQPDVTVIVRHEFWPAFIAEARKSRLYLINASVAEHPSWLTRFLKKRFFQAFDHIFVVDQEQKRIFCDSYGVLEEKLSISKDSKFDRVFERAQAAGDSRRLDSVLGSFSKAGLRLVIGSAWPKDIDVVLKAFLALKAERKDSALILAPHRVDEQSIEGITQMLKRSGVTPKRFSKLNCADDDDSADSIVIIDEIGVLAEIYSLANIAFVGGGMHHKVHNVLEPAVYSLSVACGPHYQNSSEAKLLLAQEGLAICRDQAQVYSWLKSEWDEAFARGKNAFNILKAECGAAERVCRKIMHDVLN